VDWWNARIDRRWVFIAPTSTRPSIIDFTRLSCTDTLQTTTPLVNKIILTWLTDTYIYYRLTDEQKAAGDFKQPRGIGYGIGLAFALFVMQGLSLPYVFIDLLGMLTGAGSTESASLVCLAFLFVCRFELIA
jgi:hypothetical protein